MIFAAFLFVAFLPRAPDAVSFKGKFGDNVTELYTEIDGRITTLKLTGQMPFLDVWKEMPADGYSTWFEEGEVFWF